MSGVRLERMTPEATFPARTPAGAPAALAAVPSAVPDLINEILGAGASGAERLRAADASGEILAEAATGPVPRDAALALLACRHDLLDEADPARLGRIELVRTKQVVHRVPPTAPRDEAKRGPAEGGHATSRLELGESSIVGRHHDVAGQGQLDADGVGDALDCGHLGLAQASSKAQWIHAIGAKSRGIGVRPEEERHLKSGGGVVAGEAQHADEE